MWKILVVDDDFGTRKLMNRILHRKGFVDQAVSGREALGAFMMSQDYSEPYDIILLDVTMPDMDGVEVLKEIRKLEASRGSQPVPIIMVTGRKDTMMNSFGSGCNEYLIKPISPKILLDKVKQLISENE